jgi:hypothetical protein
VEHESGVPDHIALELAALGHDIRTIRDTITFGRGEIIFRTGHGTPHGRLRGGLLKKGALMSLTAENIGIERQLSTTHQRKLTPKTGHISSVLSLRRHRMV